MATPGELVRVIAASTGEDHSTVASHDRNLVVAGLRSKSGRGTSAAKVTPRDGAHILTALLGSHRVKDSVETVRRHMQTQESHAYERQHYPEDISEDRANVWEHFGIPELTALPRDHSFVDALTVLIELAAEGRLIRELGNFAPFGGLKVIATSPRTHARISIFRGRTTGKHDPKSVQADYVPNEPPAEWVKNKRQPTPEEIQAYSAPQPPRLHRWTEMNALPIVYIGALLAGKIDEIPKIGEGSTP